VELQLTFTPKRWTAADAARAAAYMDSVSRESENGADQRVITLEPGEVYESAEHRLPSQPSFAAMSSQQRNASLDVMAKRLTDLTTAVNALTDIMNAQASDISALSARVVQDAKALAALAAVNGRLDFVSRSFMARLRWLVTGR
jgi:hypothetical protein